jgi:hypothetical protein
MYWIPDIFVLSDLQHGSIGWLKMSKGRKGTTKHMKKWRSPVSPMRLSWNTGSFISLFLYDAAMLLGVPLIRFVGDAAKYELKYIWHKVIKECSNEECKTKTLNDPPFPAQMKRDDENNVWIYECPACGQLHYPHFIEAFVEVVEYGKIKLTQMQGTHAEMEKRVREAWDMAVAFTDMKHRGHKEMIDKIKKLPSSGV